MMQKVVLLVCLVGFLGIIYAETIIKDTPPVLLTNGSLDGKQEDNKPVNVPSAGETATINQSVNEDTGGNVINKFDVLIQTLSELNKSRQKRLEENSKDVKSSHSEVLKDLEKANQLIYADGGLIAKVSKTLNDFDKFNISKIRENEDGEFTCVANNRFLISKKLVKDEMQSGYAYIFKDFSVVKSWKYIHVYSNEDVRKIRDTICVRDGITPVIAYTIQGKTCDSVQVKTYYSICRSACRRSPVQFHSSAVACCECSVGDVVSAWKEDLDWYTKFMGVDEINQGALDNINYYDILVDYDSLHYLADVISLLALITGSTVMYGAALLFSLSDVFGGDADIIGILLSICFRAVVTYPGAQVKANYDMRLLFVGQSLGIVLLYVLKLYPSPFLLLLSILWYVAIIMLIASAVYESKGDDKRVFQTMIGLFLINGVGTNLGNAVSEGVLGDTKSFLVMITHVLTGPTRGSLLLIPSAPVIADRAFNSAPAWVLVRLGLNSGVVLLVLTVIWHVFFVLMIKASMNKLTTVYSGNRENATRLNFILQSCFDLPKLDSFREVLLFIVLVLKGTGGIDLLIVLYVFAIASKFSSGGGSFLTESELADIRIANERHRNKNNNNNTNGNRNHVNDRNSTGVNRVGAIYEGEVGEPTSFDLLGTTYEQGVAVVSEGFDDLIKVVNTVKTDFKIREGIQRVVEEARKTVHSISYELDGKTYRGVAVSLVAGANTSRKMVTIFHVVANLWNSVKQEIGKFVEVMIDRTTYKVRVDKEPVLFKSDSDRCVYFSQPGVASSSDAVIGDVVDGDEVVIVTPDKQKIGTVQKLTTHIYKILGVDIDFGDSGAGVFKTSLSHDNKPICVGVVAAKFQGDAKGCTFHSIKTSFIVGTLMGEVKKDSPTNLNDIRIQRMNKDKNKIIDREKEKSKGIVKTLVTSFSPVLVDDFKNTDNEVLKDYDKIVFKTDIEKYALSGYNMMDDIDAVVAVDFLYMHQGQDDARNREKREVANSKRLLDDLQTSSIRRRLDREIDYIQRQANTDNY